MTNNKLNTAGAKIVNLATGSIADAVDIEGGYFVTQSIEITDTEEAGKIPRHACVAGALCYCKSDNRFYQYNGAKWVFADTEETIKLSEDLWTDKTIGYIQGTASIPVKIASAGESLKTVFTNIFGTVTDDTSNLVTNPYISSVSIGNSSYEYGTELTSVSVTVTPVAGNYKYGPAVEGAGWSGNYTFSGTGFTTKKNNTTNTQTISLSNTFTVGVSSALTLNVSRAYNAATNTAKSKMGAATTQKITAGTATNSGTFNPTANKYVYYAVTDSTATPSSWTLYGLGQTDVTDLSITADAGKYVWIAATASKTSIYAFNQVSNSYNTDKTPTTKTTNQTITNSQGADASGYTLYRTTNPKANSGTVKYKLA